VLQWDDEDLAPEFEDHESYGLGDGLYTDDEYHSYFFDDDDYEEDYAGLYDGSAYMDDEYAFDDDYEYSYLGSFYDLLDEEAAGEAVKLSRVTTLGATKSDIATMLWRVIEQEAESHDNTAPCEADNCIVLRMLTMARANRYRIVRTPTPGLYVESSSLSGEPDAETHPCNCNSASPSQGHCFLSLAQVCARAGWGWGSRVPRCARGCLWGRSGCCCLRYGANSRMRRVRDLTPFPPCSPPWTTRSTRSASTAC
jgi:hypothetical protein